MDRLGILVLRVQGRGVGGLGVSGGGGKESRERCVMAGETALAKPWRVGD